VFLSQKRKQKRQGSTDSQPALPDFCKI